MSGEVPVVDGKSSATDEAAAEEVADVATAVDIGDDGMRDAEVDRSIVLSPQHCSTLEVRNALAIVAVTVDDENDPRQELKMST